MSFALPCAGFILLLSVRQSLAAEEIIEVQGEYKAANFNPVSKAHEQYVGSGVHASFTVLLSKSEWLISATNLDDSLLFCQIWSDGTNTFTLNPVPSPDQHNNAIVATASASQYYLSSNDDYLHISLCWLVYGLCPGTVSSNKSGLVDIPLPWRNPRFTPEAYGYKWTIRPSNDGRFAADCVVTRDKSLDLPDKQEFLRPELVYPTSIAMRNKYEMYKGRRLWVTNGFVVARYSCTNWYLTNGWSVPKASTANFYWADGGQYCPNTWFEGSVVSTSILFLRGPIEFPKPKVPTAVVDFRYRRFNGARLFRGAQYTLKAGESWRSARDPVLLAEAEHFLQHGPRYDDLDHWKRTVVWMLIVALVALPWAFMLLRKLNKRKTNRKENHEKI